MGVFAFGQSVPDAGLVAAAAVAVRGPRSPSNPALSNSLNSTTNIQSTSYPEFSISSIIYQYFRWRNKTINRTKYALINGCPTLVSLA